MLKKILLLLLVFASPAFAVEINAENFPDENFRQFLLTEFDIDGDDNLSQSEIAAINELIVNGCEISSLQGIENFTELEYLDCGNNTIASLDLSANTKLTDIICDNNLLETLDLSSNTALLSLNCMDNLLVWLNIDNCTSLNALFMLGNNLPELNIAGCPMLYNIEDSFINYYFDFDENVTEIVFEHVDNPKIPAKPRITTSIIPDAELGTSFSFQLKARGTSPITWSAENLPGGLRLSGDIITGTPTISGDFTFTARAENSLGNDTASLRLVVADTITINAEHFPDEKFRVFLTVLERDSFDGDGKFSRNEIAQVKDIDISDGVEILIDDEYFSGKIESLEGIEFFTSLETLTCENNALTGLNLSVNTNLKYLQCGRNSITSLNLSGCNSLVSLDCATNSITILDLSDNSALKECYCDNNPLQWLNIDSCTELSALSIMGVDIPKLNIGSCPKLYTREEVYDYDDDGNEVFTGYAYTYNFDFDGDVTEIVFEHVDNPLVTLSITTSSLKVGTIGKSYSVTLKAKGTKPYTWSATGLPNGLKFSEKGKISGKATEFGTFNVTFTVSNETESITKELTLTIKGIVPKISGSLAKAELSVPYSSGLKLKKGSLPITWNVTGNLPDGLSLDASTGIISGTPVSYKSSGFKLKITASNGAGEKSKSLKLKVKGKKPKITASFPSATQGQPYEATLTATGSQPITWTAANLPEGLSLDGNTISGTPTGTAKSYRVKLTATNPVKSAKKTLTLKVNASTVNENAMNSQSSNGFEYFPVLTEIPSGQISGGYVIVAELGTISADESGMYEFGIALSDDVPEGTELIYLANSDEPSDDDEIVEFYDDEGNEISSVPESRKITISIWLNKEVIYSPEIAVKI
ncbi:MAG: putative Ig domain-containing protein [Synergistaceae bacterium]|nr:putative Ig domain-containing protein [Synergistaceae bacterium]